MQAITQAHDIIAPHTGLSGNAQLPFRVLYHWWLIMTIRSCALSVIASCLFLTAAPAPLDGETGVLVVHLMDVQRRPINGAAIGVEGDGATALTAVDGKARIRLAPDTKERTWISLQIVKSPPHRDLVIVSPWDYKTLVPPFANESANFVEVVVVQRGDRSALESGTVLIALTARINQANAGSRSEDTQAHLNAVAKDYGISAQDLDQHIREWGQKTADPFQRGLVALYAGNYEQASEDLSNSLQEQEKRLQQSQKDVADRAFFLGASRHEEGKYRESVTAYERCLELRRNDPTVLNNLGQSVADTGDFNRAQKLFEQALDIRKATLGEENADTAQSLDSLALVLQSQGNFAEAEKRYLEARGIRERVLGAYARETVITNNSLAAVLYSEGKYQQSEQIFREVLEIRDGENPNGLDTAQTLDSLALCLQAENKLVEAASDYRRALAIRQKVLPAEHPSIAQTENSLASLLYDQGEFSQAKELYESALEIRKHALGPDHPLTAATMDGLGLVLAMTDPPAGEASIRQALQIQELKLGNDHPDTATTLDHLGTVLEKEGQWDEAQRSLEQALSIRSKVLGSDHPVTRISREHLRELQEKRAKIHQF